MATVDNASILAGFYDAYNAKDLDRLASCVAADAQATSMAFGTKVGLMEHLQAWAHAFPDAQLEVKNLVAQGDYVSSEIVWRGTHTGTLKEPTGDLPATGRRLELPLAEVFRFRDGKIVEFRYYFDAFSFFKQLGVGAPEAGAEAGGATTAPAMRH